MMVLLYPSAGIISLMMSESCLNISLFFMKGKFGISVNKNKNDGGMAMIKL